MIFSLDIRRAGKGDCLILHFGTKKRPGLILIDGGPKAVYAPHLKPRLLSIRKARSLKREDSLPVDVLMVSHVDDDHIQGILDLTKEEIANADARQPKLFNVHSLWHNSFDEIIGSAPANLTASMTAAFAAAAAGGVDLPDDKVESIEDIFLDGRAGSDDEGREEVNSALKVLASISQGYRLRKDAERLEYPRNAEFDDALIVAAPGMQPKSIAGSLQATIIGPTKDEILALHSKHQEWLEKLKKEGKTPEEALAAYVDRSVTNLSSIVVLMKLDGKTMLLTGDARGDKILTGLQQAGLLDPGDDSTMEIDLLKVPHHGSSNNLDRDFFERIIARHYVFSGDGKHGNPERETMEMLWKARGDTQYEVHLTYPLKSIDEEREKDWNKERNKETARKKKKGTGDVREKWSPAAHGLVAFFDEHPLFRKKLRINEDDKPHVIDLADRLADIWPTLAEA